MIELIDSLFLTSDFVFFVIEIKMIFFIFYQKSIDYKGQAVLPSLSLSFIFSGAVENYGPSCSEDLHCENRYSTEL